VCRNGLLRIKRLTRRSEPGALVDERGEAFARLGVDDAAQYLVRPDGYVGSMRRSGVPRARTVPRRVGCAAAVGLVERVAVSFRASEASRGILGVPAERTALCKESKDSSTPRLRRSAR
jgi:hypothetical protein